MATADTFMSTRFLTAVADHVWQSTIVFLCIWGFTATLRQNRAAVRHRLWLIASCKFLVPYGALTWLGGQFAGMLPTAAYTPVTRALSTASEPFAQVIAYDAAGPLVAPLSPSPVMALVVTAWVCGVVAVLSGWVIGWLRVTRVAAADVAINDGPVAESLARVRARLGADQSLPIRICSGQTEPGIFGIWRPVLLWPRALTTRLSEPEMDAIVAHELAHVRRYDNLISALHTVARAFFWFHPALWWTGRMLEVERERACDEEVLMAGYAPRAYAEGIVKTCEFCIQAPAAVAAGVTGSLTTRVVEIMRGHSASMLGSLQRVALSTAGLAALLIPLAIGATAPVLRAQAPAVAGGSPAFEVASIKPNLGSDLARRFEATPGGRVNLINLTPREMIFRAYQTQDHLVVGGPPWLNADRFDIVAKAADNAPPGQMLMMVRTLLADRFKLVMHRETREMPIYNLVLARGDGRGVQPKPTTCVQPPPGGPAPSAVRDAQGRFTCGVNRFGGGEILLTGSTLDALANRLGSVPGVGRSVVNRTGLDGRFDIELTFTPTLSASPSADGLSVFTSLEEQAGLKLEAARGPVEVLVIDSVARPEPD